MRIGFIAPKYTSDFKTLEQRVQERRHTIEFLPFFESRVSRADLDTVVDRCAHYDVLHYYAGFGDVIGIAIGELLQARGLVVVNNSAALPPYVENKLYQVLECERAGLSVPKTIRAYRPRFDVLAEELGLPFIAKKLRGQQGNDVHRITVPEDLKTLMGRQEYLYQEYVPHRSDFRVHVLGGRQAFCSYKRVPTADDFRANVSRGATMEAISDPEELAAVTNLAVRAAELMKYDLCGVDIFRSETDGQYRIIEINRNPGWKNVTEVTKQSFEDVLIDYYETLSSL